MIRLVEYPRYFEPTCFARVRDGFVARAIRNRWVKGIWQFGGDQPIPGYSDVDLLIWVDRREAPVTALLSPFVPDAGLEGARVFRHAPVVVDDESLRRLCYYVDPTLAQFRQLAGPPFPLPALGEAETAAVQLAKAFDCLPRAFSLLVRFLNLPEAPVVRVVRQLNHFAIDCGRLCALDLLDAPRKRKASRLVHDLAELRASLWRETSDELARELSALLRRAFELYFELMPSLDAAQRRLGFENPIETRRSPTALITDVGGYVVRDVEDIRERLGTKPPSHFYRQDAAGGMAPVVPVSPGFLAQMLLYGVESPGEGFLDFLASHWIGDEPSLLHDANLLAASPEREGDVYGRVVAQRSRLAHGHMEFLAESGIVRGLEPAFTGMLWTFRRLMLLARRRGRGDDVIRLARRRRAILSRGGWEL